jgi:hypothetical protein
MFEKLKSFFTGAKTGVEMSAATKLASDPLPSKVAKQQQTLPSFLRSAKPPTESPLLRADRLLANKNILDYRLGNDSRQVIRDFTRSDPNLSAAVTSYIRTGITAGYTAIARNPDGTVNPEGTTALAQIITRMNVLNDYTIGYDDGRSVRSLSEAWAREIFTMGAMCGELVLDKLRLPSHIHPIASAQVRLFPSSDGRKLVPKQFIAGEYINLDIPTFFMVTLDEDLLDPYPISPIEPAVQAVLFGAEFLNDIRRVVKRAIHPRAVVTIDEEKFKKNIPAEYQNDTDKINAYMTSVVSDLETKVNGLNPEDAIVMFDTIGIEIVDHGNTNLSNEYTVIQGMADAKLAAGAKVLPTVLGHSDGTSNTASAEVLLFMKFVEGTVWAKLNEMFSKMFTLSTRLMGYDVTVDFKYNEIDLKPTSELESFKAMKQSRVLQLCSLGLLTDEETSIQLTGALPPAGMKPLSGTGFFEAKAAVPAGDGQNGASNSGSTMNNAMRPTTPTAPKGGAGKPKGEGHLVVMQ